MLPIKNILKRLLLIGLSIQLLCAWTVGSKPLDGTLSNLCTQSVVVVNPNFDPYYNKDLTPLTCNRWGLTWRLYESGTPNKILDEIQDISTNEDGDFFYGVDGVDGTYNWQVLLRASDPGTGTSAATYGTTRLPTIKELVRIFEYDASSKSTAGVPATDHVFRAWLQADEAAATTLTGYLVSSTYRHINSTAGTNDGEMDADNDKSIRVLAVEIGTGRVVALDPSLKLCASLDTDAVCAATEVQVYALLVGPI